MNEELKDELKRLFPKAWAWYVADWADVCEEEPPKYELDEMITFLLRNCD